MMITSMATLLQSYVFIKLFFLTLFLLAFLVNLGFNATRIVVHGRLIWFYVCLGMSGVAWTLVGVLHPSNYIQGNLEALRLYVAWSAAFVVLYTLLRAGPSLRTMHTAIVAAGILIPLINLVGLVDEFSGLGIISEGIRHELQMEIGFGDGYIQFSSMNISSMFVIAPYLVALQFRKEAGKSNSAPARIALTLSLVLVAVSGRRALWVVTALTPCTVLLLSIITDSYNSIRKGAKRFLLVCAVAGVLAPGVLLIIPNKLSDVGAFNRLEDAFSSDDFRAIQRPYLVHAFMQSPILGSGFGAYAGYTRSDERPWMYELTYYQMLLNLGIVGVTVLGGLFTLYLVKVLRLLRQFKDGSAVPFGLLVGFCSLLVGAYSNPYLGGFDSLFFLGLLPYLSTFVDGFGRP